MTSDMVGLPVPRTVRTCSRRKPIFRHLPGESAPGAGVTRRVRQESATVRWCAHVAIRALGLTPKPIASSSSGAPVWQTGIVGSMTHCDGYYAAAVALTDDVRHLGIDAEANVPVQPMIMQRVATEEETSMIERLPTHPDGPIWERVLISAKEAAFKATSVLLSHPVAWWRYTVEINPDGSWTALPPSGLSLPVADPTGKLAGRWALDRDTIVTSISIPQGRPRTMHARLDVHE